jgi:predicted transcriptional regulator
MTSANGPTEHAQYIAARHQHQNTLKLRRGLKELALSTEEFASLAGVSYDRMAKMLRGVLIMRLEDIAMAEYLVHRPLRDREHGS